MKVFIISDFWKSHKSLTSVVFTLYKFFQEIQTQCVQFMFVRVITLTLGPRYRLLLAVKCPLQKIFALLLVCSMNVCLLFTDWVWLMTVFVSRDVMPWSSSKSLPPAHSQMSRFLFLLTFAVKARVCYFEQRNAFPGFLPFFFPCMRLIVFLFFFADCPSKEKLVFPLPGFIFLKTVGCLVYLLYWPNFFLNLNWAVACIHWLSFFMLIYMNIVNIHLR